jgi:hypothetical protein
MKDATIILRRNSTSVIEIKLPASPWCVKSPNSNPSPLPNPVVGKHRPLHFARSPVLPTHLLTHIRGNKVGHKSVWSLMTRTSYATNITSFC